MERWCDEVCLSVQSHRDQTSKSLPQEKVPTLDHDVVQEAKGVDHAHTEGLARHRKLQLDHQNDRSQTRG